MGEVHLLPSNGDRVGFEPKEVLGRSQGPTLGRMSLLTTDGIGVQGYLAHKKTPTPLGTP